MSTPAIEARLCECGCGEATPIATKTCARDGRVKGRAARFVKGHNARGPRRAPASPAPSRKAKPRRSSPLSGTVTGHQLGDRMLPAAMQLVGAVRRGDPRAAHQAVAQARRVSYGHSHWMFAFLCTVAALVPEDQTTSQLLAWVDVDDDEMRIPA